MSKLSVILWTVSGSISVLFIVATGLIIYDWSNQYEPDPSQLSKHDEIKTYLANKWANNDHRPEALVLVPSGLFIESMYFVNSNNVHVSGYVWQKYDKNAAHLEKKEIIFPEAIEVLLTETYRRMEDGILTIGWYFEGQFIQNFDYFDFPMDNKVVWLRMWHSEFDKNVVLTPDLAAYDSTTASDKFGLDPEIVLSGYTIVETFFNFNKSNYDTDFGVKNYIGKKNFPELYYNVVLKRNVINSSIIYFLPLFTVIILMFFGMLLIVTREDRISFLGYNLLSLLNFSAFLLFIVVLSHIQLRTQVTSESIMYIEYLYIITYAAIVFSVIIAFIIDKASQSNDSWLIARDGLWAKVSFFPLVSLAMYLATYFSF